MKGTKGKEDALDSADIIHMGGYDLTCSPMTANDITRLHELSVSVSWPHRAADWTMILDLGRGYVARDEIDRIVGSAMWFPIGDRIASIGMVITSPRLQDNGAGRWLMTRVLEETQGRVRVLNATKAAFRLYVSLGFSVLAPSFQMNGFVHSCGDFPDTARTMQPADHDAIIALDQQAFGQDRTPILQALLARSEGLVIERDGRLEGLSLMRHFGRGRVIGPIVAASDRDALALTGPFVAAHQGKFLRVDTREATGPFRDFLQHAGIVHHDTVQRMSLEPFPLPAGPARTYGLVNQALG